MQLDPTYAAELKEKSRQISEEFSPPGGPSQKAIASCLETNCPRMYRLLRKNGLLAAYCQVTMDAVQRAALASRGEYSEAESQALIALVPSDKAMEDQWLQLACLDMPSDEKTSF